MTTEERLNRIEHVTAGLAEQHRKDHEEDRQLWRDTQRQITELSARTIELSNRTLQMGDELRHAIDRMAQESRVAIQQLASETREADRRLSDRIDSLVTGVPSGSGQLTARMGIPPQPRA